MKFDSKETEEYFYSRCKSMKCNLTIRYDDVIDYEYVKNFLDMVEDGLKSGRFQHLNEQ